MIQSNGHDQARSNNLTVESLTKQTGHRLGNMRALVRHARKQAARLENPETRGNEREELEENLNDVLIGMTKLMREINEHPARFAPEIAKLEDRNDRTTATQRIADNVNEATELYNTLMEEVTIQE